MLWKKAKSQSKEPGKMTTIEFANRNDGKKIVWIEPTCVELELETHTEYLIITHERDFRIEFEDDTMILYLQYSFGFILNKRPTSKKISNPNSWELVFDLSDIN